MSDRRVAVVVSRHDDYPNPKPNEVVLVAGQSNPLVYRFSHSVVLGGHEADPLWWDMLRSRIVEVDDE